MVERAQKSFCNVAMVRIDADFPPGALLARFEARDIDHVLQLKADGVLDRLTKPHIARPAGRRPATPRTWLRELRYYAFGDGCNRAAIAVQRIGGHDLALGRDQAKHFDRRLQFAGSSAPPLSVATVASVIRRRAA